MQKQHLLIVLFGTNLVSNISTKASKFHLQLKKYFDKLKMFLYDGGQMIDLLQASSSLISFIQLTWAAIFFFYIC